MEVGKDVGGKMVITVEDTEEENVPIKFENHCSQLVVKIRQTGEKQVLY